MKLAEALAIRKDTQKRIEQLKSRVLNNVKIQEGEQPSEDPRELIHDMEACLKTLTTLIYQINRTNLNTFKDGKSLTEMMAERDVLTIRVNGLRDVFNKASEQMDRYSRSEIKMVSTIDIKALGKEIDQWSKKLRELDMDIQTLNFSTDLME